MDKTSHLSDPNVNKCHCNYCTPHIHDHHDHHDHHHHSKSYEHCDKSVDYIINLCNKIEKRRDIHCWKLKKIQFLESTGIQELCEPNKLVIKKVVVAGPTKQVDVTHIIKVSNGQVNDCPIDCVTVDTGKLNEYPGCDVEPGYRKIIQIDYVTDEHVDEKK